MKILKSIFLYISLFLFLNCNNPKIEKAFYNEVLIGNKLFNQNKMDSSYQFYFKKLLINYNNLPFHDTFYVNSFVNISLYFEKKGKIDSSINTLKKAFRFCGINGDELYQHKILHNLAEIYAYNISVDSSFFYINKIKLLDSTSLFFKASYYQKLSKISYIKNDFNKSLNYIDSASIYIHKYFKKKKNFDSDEFKLYLDIDFNKINMKIDAGELNNNLFDKIFVFATECKKNKNNYYYYNTLSRLGDLYFTIGDYKNGILFQDSALNYFSSSKNTISAAYSFLNLSVSYNQTGLDTLSLNYAKKSLIYLPKNDNRARIKSLFLITSTYFRLNKVDSFLLYYKILKNIDINSLNENISLILYLDAVKYYYEKKYFKAIKLLNLSVSEFIKNKDYLTVKGIYMTKSVCYEQLNMYKEYALSLSQYISYDDSINYNLLQGELINAEQKHNAQKFKELLKVTSSNLKEESESKNKYQSFTIWLVVIVVIFALLLLKIFQLIFKYESKNQELLILQNAEYLRAESEKAKAKQWQELSHNFKSILNSEFDNQKLITYNGLLFSNLLKEKSFISDEIDLVSAYFDLINKKIIFNYSKNSKLLNTNIIPISLLPLAVNYITYGFANNHYNDKSLIPTFNIEILELNYEYYQIKISNNGNLTIKESSSGTGIKNLKARLTYYNNIETELEVYVDHETKTFIIQFKLRKK